MEGSSHEPPVQYYYFYVRKEGILSALFCTTNNADRRIRRIETVCHCEFRIPDNEFNQCQKLYNLIEIKYDTNLGNHRGCLQMLFMLCQQISKVNKSCETIQPCLTISTDGYFTLMDCKIFAQKKNEILKTCIQSSKVKYKGIINCCGSKTKKDSIRVQSRGATNELNDRTNIHISFLSDILKDIKENGSSRIMATSSVEQCIRYNIFDTILMGKFPGNTHAALCETIEDIGDLFGAIVVIQCKQTVTQTLVRTLKYSKWLFSTIFREEIYNAIRCSVFSMGHTFLFHKQKSSIYQVTKQDKGDVSSYSSSQDGSKMILKSYLTHFYHIITFHLLFIQVDAINEIVEHNMMQLMNFIEDTVIEIERNKRLEDKKEEYLIERVMNKLLGTQLNAEKMTLDTQAPEMN